MSLAERVAEARETLVRGGVPADEAPGDAEVLARHALGWDLATFVTRRRDPAPAGFESAYQPLIERRLTREPVSQIVGHREFWGLEFEVTREVLTPRPETELIVEEALAAFPDRHAPLAIQDIGTGSGCLAIALAREFPSARVTATDISESAIDVARRNARRHGVVDRIAFRHTSETHSAERFDLVVSNPPYIPAGDAPALAPEVRDFEPASALFSGGDGLDMIRTLLRDLVRQLTPGGRLILEVGHDQAARVAGLASELGWTVERVRADLQRIPRTLVLSRRI